MTSRGTTESRPGEPGYSERGQTSSITPPDRNTGRGAQDPTASGGGYTPPWEEPDTNDEPDQPESWRDYVEDDVNPYEWIDVVAGEVTKSLSAWGKANGYSSDIMGQIYSKHAPQMFQEIQIWGFRGSDQMEYRTTTPEGMQEMVDWAINWFSGKTGMPLTRKTSGGSGRRGRGRGRGRTGPTAEEIRNQFDMDELTNAINEMNRAILLEDNPNARKLATEYVDQIVATKGEKEIDFATFVEEKIKETSRFKSIYRSKPEHLSPVQYMAPYLNAARQMAAPDDADDIAIQGAQFAAAPQDFQARLEREDSVTGSSPYINGLEARLSNLNQIFAGS